MIAYEFDEKGKLKGEKNCQIDPLESKKAKKEIYLLPANCTFEKPPKEKDDNFIIWDGKKWNYEAVPKYEPTYKEKRAAEYPSYGDQLDMIYWDKVNNTNIWVDTISAIKAKYPKEEA